ncbi:MAG: aldo/keto reductase [Clostridia bacterium]|nr:aldo/keto reductase [Clostridia bacterium]
MLYTHCGRSGLKLPVISLGLWQNFGERAAYENSKAIITTAFGLGITHFDLANNYGPPPGAAEETFGAVLQKDLKNHRDEMIISSKAGYTMWPGPYGDGGSRKYMIASCDQSLRRTGLEYFDIFYSHRPDPATPIEETMGALADLVKQGKALYAGISNYSAEGTAAAYEALNAQGEKLLIHQENYSMLRRASEEKLQPWLKENGVGMIAFCPLAQGMLTDRYLHGVPVDSRAASASPFLKEIPPENITRARNLNEIAKARGQTLAQMALAWVLRDGVCSALIGASRVSQVEENVAALDNLAFSDDEIIAIDSALVV